ncbi:class I SAM-dependent methyltransferase [Halopseudomonas salegens]|uniref:Ribosomal RNA small subunit methyltransferase J n=1 Tax=Halopseudomonas salegens TaxID=1434072 RepID=A0A1H2EF44_9GAMM|nr:class I SAM-dependent methyltransferase [Halopseudomonas salegens]SDT93711.1 16S rRNA (guanine1516-N2)-methyltransferase [Halopseudomonas salegens]
MADDMPVAVITCTQPACQAQAEKLAQALGLPLQQLPTGLYLQVAADGLSLHDADNPQQGGVRVDFVTGSQAHRRQFGGGAGQMVARAVGCRGGVRPHVLDATAGLGRDAFVLASLGCEVTLIERQPVIATLLADGLDRARMAGGEVAEIVARMTLICGDAIDLIDDWQGEPPQVIHLDPMFPQRDKSALVKKEMRLFKPLAGSDEDAPQLLAAALQLASHRVVVKRPRKAPELAGRPPSSALSGQSSRYDIYGIRALNKP